ncbi:hypothetical protein [Cupriavidus basilensis]|uniref:Ribosomal protein S3AE n=1 Tax=Cupriavidus basilensis TaxID=68895 RepID=A0A643G2V0_9BURK|nr:hypothetical protein [Cupriavidus basilensis]MDR3383458.1 hypothetical protein [Cupriavidus basilensis]QOT78250.1 hypothetical protein F7R26_009690 [Cupriavidus basilensis]
MNAPFPIRKECPPGACTCGREALLDDPQSDMRILRLTREEEKRLIARLESLSSLAELKDMEKRMHAQLGIVVTITPSIHEVRTVRGINIQVEEQTGLCRKTKQAIPAAIRRCLEAKPDIAYAILDAHDLLGGA